LGVKKVRRVSSGRKKFSIWLIVVSTGLHGGILMTLGRRAALGGNFEVVIGRWHEKHAVQS
jgi:hypothetical protein